MLEGKQYNRAVGLHKLTYEALMWLVWKGFQEWLESDHSESLCKLNNTIHTLCDLHGNTSHESLNGALTNDSCIELLDLFVAYQDILRQNSGQLAQFWMYTTIWL